MRLQVMARGEAPFDPRELEGLGEEVERRLAPHASRVRRVVVSVGGARMLELRGEVVLDEGRLRVDHLDAGRLPDAAPYFADRVRRAVARALSLAEERRGR